MTPSVDFLMFCEVAPPSFEHTCYCAQLVIQFLSLVYLKWNGVHAGMSICHAEVASSIRVALGAPNFLR